MISQSIISKKNQNKWYKKIINEKNSKYFNIFYKNELIGSGSIKNIDKKNMNCTWGFYIFNRFKGPYGLLSEIKIIENVFNIKNIQKLYGQTLQNNSAILKIHKFCGFKVEGVLKHHILRNGEKLDLILTSLFKKDWKNKKKEIRKILNI